MINLNVKKLLKRNNDKQGVKRKIKIEKRKKRRNEQQIEGKVNYKKLRS